jgi:hypothetical protein
VLFLNFFSFFVPICTHTDKIHTKNHNSRDDKNLYLCALGVLGGYKKEKDNNVIIYITSVAIMI